MLHVLGVVVLYQRAPEQQAQFQKVGNTHFITRSGYVSIVQTLKSGVQAVVKANGPFGPDMVTFINHIQMMNLKKLLNSKTSFVALKFCPIR